MIETVIHWSFHHINGFSLQKDNILFIYLEIAHEFPIFYILGKICSYVNEIQNNTIYIISSLCYVWKESGIYLMETFVARVRYTQLTANKGNNKITELRTILQRESQNS
jgi:hypothetical protein